MTELEQRVLEAIEAHAWDVLTVREQFADEILDAFFTKLLDLSPIPDRYGDDQ